MLFFLFFLMLNVMIWTNIKFTKLFFSGSQEAMGYRAVPFIIRDMLVIIDISSSVWLKHISV